MCDRKGSERARSKPYPFGTILAVATPLPVTLFRHVEVREQLARRHRCVVAVLPPSEAPSLLLGPSSPLLDNLQASSAADAVIRIPTNEPAKPRYPEALPQLRPVGEKIS